MLFDLRGRGRRRTVQVVYLTLALLLGGGLVLFGIGGDVQGGLFDAFSQNQGSVSDQTKDRVKDAEKATKARPEDPDAWRNLAEAQYQLAGQSEGFNEQTGEFTGAARRQLEKVEQSWNRHVQLSNGKPNADLAATMRGALVALGKPEEAVKAQEVVIDNLDEPGFGDLAQLAQLAYLAGQSRKGDLAAQKAKELAPKDQKKAVEQSLRQAKSQAVAQQAQGGAAGAGAGGAAPPAAPAPAGE